MGMIPDYVIMDYWSGRSSALPCSSGLRLHGMEWITLTHVSGLVTFPFADLILLCSVLEHLLTLLTSLAGRLDGSKVSPLTYPPSESDLRDGK